jgi:hypothetical protein
MYFQSDNSPITQITEKLRGFVGFKARVTVRVEITSQPFQAGGLMMHYIPYSEYMSSHAAWYASGNVTNLVAATGCPHVMCNIADAAAMVFETPYVAPYLYFNLATGQGSFGTVYLSVLSQLASQTSSTATYSVFARFTDVELVFPTDAPLTTVFAQSGEISQMKKSGQISSAVSKVGAAAGAILPFVGLSELQKPVGMLTTTATNVLKMFGLSKPTVEGMNMRVKQAPAQYMTNSDGSDTSHKLSLSAANERPMLPYFAGTNVDEMQLAYRAAQMCYVFNTAWGTNDIADTVITYQATGPTALSVWNTRISNAHATQLSMPMCARVATDFAYWRGDLVFKFIFFKTPFHAGKVRLTFRPYAWADTATVQNMPGYDVTKIIDLANSSMVTMRIPYVSTREWLSTQYDPTVSVYNNDVRNFTTGTIQLTVVNPLVASSTVSSIVDIAVFASMENAQFAGPLKSAYTPYNIPNVANYSEAHSRTAPHRVSRAVYTSDWHEDFVNYHVPNTRYARVLKDKEKKEENKANQPPAENKPKDTAIYAQSGGMPTIIPSKEFTQEAAKPAHLPISPYANTVGEVVASYKQLLMRSDLAAVVTLNAMPADTVNAGMTGNSLVLFPWAPNPPPAGPITVNTVGRQTPGYQNVNTLGNAVIATQIDMYSKLYPIFGFFYGSMRIKIFVSKPGTQFDRSLPWTVYFNTMNMPQSGCWQPTMTSNSSSSLTNITSGLASFCLDIPAATATTPKTGYTFQPAMNSTPTKIFPDLEGAIEFEVPYYATTHMVPTTYGYYEPMKMRSAYYPTPKVTIVGPQTTAGTAALAGSTLEIYRSVGDDFRFGASMGSPDSLFWYSMFDPQ